MIRKISNILKLKRENKEAVFSFEVFPPKTSGGTRSLFETVAELSALDPDFISVTYGAGGSSAEATLDIAGKIQNRFGITAMHHLTLVNQTIEELKLYIERMASAGIRNVLVLRGDPPREMGAAFKKIEGGLEYAYELIDLVRAVGGDFFSIGVAGFPECHVDCPTEEIDSAYLKMKVDHGAEFVITQFFFDNSSYADYGDRISAAGASLPILPGVLPIMDYRRMLHFCETCGAHVCWEVHQIFAPVASDRAETLRRGTRYGIDQSQNLMERGAPGIHFYSLNKVEPVRTIWEHLKGYTVELKSKRIYA